MLEVGVFLFSCCHESKINLKKDELWKEKLFSSNLEDSAPTNSNSRSNERLKNCY